MSYTMHLEIIHKDYEYKGWYTPAIDGFAKYPRNDDGAQKASIAFMKLAKKTDFIKECRVVIYKGRVYHYSKVKEIVGIVPLGEYLNG